MRGSPFLFSVLSSHVSAFSLYTPELYYIDVLLMFTIFILQIKQKSNLKIKKG